DPTAFLHSLLAGTIVAAMPPASSVPVRVDGPGALRMAGVGPMITAIGNRVVTALVGPAIVALLVGVVFAADTITPWQIAVGAFYAIAVLTAVIFYDRRGVLIIAGICLVLGLLSFVITGESLSALFTEITAVAA